MKRRASGQIFVVLFGGWSRWIIRSPLRIALAVASSVALFVVLAPKLVGRDGVVGVDIETDQQAIIARHFGCFVPIYHRDKVYQAVKPVSANTPVPQKMRTSRLLLTRAKAARAGFDRVMTRIVTRIDGATYYGSRVKGEPRLKEKLDSWRTPEKISDYIGCRITVTDHAALFKVLVALALRFDVVHHEDFLDGHAFKTGYRAIHTQLVGRRLEALGGDEYWRQKPCNPYKWGKDPREEHEWPLHGLSAEVQILPSMVSKVQTDYRWVYEKWRKYQMDHEIAKLTAAKAEERARDYATMTNAYQKAAEEWERSK